MWFLKIVEISGPNSVNGLSAESANNHRNDLFDRLRTTWARNNHHIDSFGD
jgi:hypothetical protein